MYWKHQINIKHIFSDNIIYEKVKEEMNSIATVLESHFFMNDFPIDKFKSPPIENNIHYFNNLLFELYEYCDENKIWVN